MLCCVIPAAFLCTRIASPSILFTTFRDIIILCDIIMLYFFLVNPFLGFIFVDFNLYL